MGDWITLGILVLGFFLGLLWLFGKGVSVVENFLAALVVFLVLILADRLMGWPEVVMTGLCLVFWGFVLWVLVGRD